MLKCKDQNGLSYLGCALPESKHSWNLLTIDSNHKCNESDCSGEQRSEEKRKQRNATGALRCASVDLYMLNDCVKSKKMFYHLFLLGK